MSFHFGYTYDVNRSCLLKCSTYKVDCLSEKRRCLQMADMIRVADAKRQGKTLFLQHLMLWFYKYLLCLNIYWYYIWLNDRCSIALTDF